jgi:hypothetical protein
MPESWRQHDLESGRAPHVESFGPEFKSGSEPGDCELCAPFACDDPDNHLGVPSEYTPLQSRRGRLGLHVLRERRIVMPSFQTMVMVELGLILLTLIIINAGIWRGK